MQPVAWGPNPALHSTQPAHAGCPAWLTTPSQHSFTSMKPPLAMLCCAQVLPADITETVEQHPRRGDLLEVSPAAPHHPRKDSTHHLRST
jgi:hypothetical protein